MDVNGHGTRPGTHAAFRASFAVPSPGRVSTFVLRLLFLPATFLFLPTFPLKTFLVLLHLLQNTVALLFVLCFALETIERGSAVRGRLFAHGEGKLMTRDECQET